MSDRKKRRLCEWSDSETGGVRGLEIATPAGAITLVLRGAALARLLLPGGLPEPEFRGGAGIGERDLPRELSELPDALRAYFAGVPVDLATLPLRFDGSGLSAFARRVLTRLREVPRGRTLSYGALARRAGSPGAARAVGGVMARNRWPLVIPCHRVISAGGGTGGFSSPGGVASKLELLELEGAAGIATG